ncbi:hypothetical protein KAS08_03985 [Candidatus Pacearchaeota archaeon]|nr:hypothetical protein [Candidatus Pacearchaeota archaeon]
MGISFDEAKYFPDVRQKFLEEIDFEKYKPFIKDVIYFEGKVGEKIMETVPDSCVDWLPNTASTIRVSGYAFRTCSLDEFYNILIPHEGFHAWQNYFEYAEPVGKEDFVNFPNGQYVNFHEKEIKQELVAHQNQINHFTFEKCSRSFQKNVYSWLRFYEELFGKFYE